MPKAEAEACFQELETLYSQLTRELPQAQGNPCGRCRECCTGKGLSAHNVTRLELDYIAARVGPERLPRFRHFLQRDGAVEVCPFFDDQNWGCGIYAHRPYSCRVFGHYRSKETALPAVCVFAGQESIFGQSEFYQAVPMAAELRELVRRYWPHQASHFEQASTNPSLTNHGAAASGDALDRALLLMNQGHLQEALQEFEASDLPSTPYVLYCLSLVFEGLGRHEDARTALEAALNDAPECAPLWFRLACNRLSLGQNDAEEAFVKTLALEPNHALAHGLLGGLYLSQGKRSEAEEHLAEARRVAPELESFARLLEQARSAAT